MVTPIKMKVQRLATNHPNIGHVELPNGSTARDLRSRQIAMGMRLRRL